MRANKALSVLLLGMAAGAAGVAVAPAWAQKPALSMLDELDRGAWDLRERGGGVRHICLESGRQLIQLRHPRMNCQSVVVDDKPDQVVVQYICRGQGYGRTQIRRETNGLIQIHSQGILNGLPFVFEGEGRRTGACRG